MGLKKTLYQGLVALSILLAPSINDNKGLENMINPAVAQEISYSASKEKSDLKGLENRINLVVGQEISYSATKENLDLPFDAVGENEEEEDAPEIVTFYGQQFEGDAFVYVTDKSGSMQDSGELAIAKREIIKNIEEFSERVKFAFVFFDNSVVKYPSNGLLVRADPGNKSAAKSFIQSVPGGIGSCCMQGLSEGLRMLNLADSKRKVMVYVGDGGGTCQGASETVYLRNTLVAITSQNYQRNQINAIGVLNPSPLGEDFMKRLAASNNGTYTRKAN